MRQYKLYNANVDTLPILVYIDYSIGIQCQLGNYNTIYDTVTLYTPSSTDTAHLISNTSSPHQHHMHPPSAPYACNTTRIPHQHHTHPSSVPYACNTTHTTHSNIYQRPNKHNIYFFLSVSFFVKH